jgi:hypothetical protein
MLFEELSLIVPTRIGPVDLTLHMLHHMFTDASLTISLASGTLPKSPKTKIPTVTDNLFYQHTIDGNEIGISFEPTN